MTSRWGWKRCSRLCSPPPCPPRHRACLDSLQIPTQRSPFFRQLPRPDIPPCFFKPCCDTKPPLCHCADQNYCTPKTCKSSSSCIQSKTLFCRYGLKENDEDNVSNEPSRDQEGDEDTTGKENGDDHVKNVNSYRISNDDESTDKNSGTYPPLNINNHDLTGTYQEINITHKNGNENNVQDTPHVNSQTIVDDEDKTNSKMVHDREIHYMTNLNRYVQINMQNETITKRERDTSSMVAPEVCCGGNDIQAEFSWTNISNVNDQTHSNLRKNLESKSERYNNRNLNNQVDEEDREPNDDYKNSILSPCCQPGRDFRSSKVLDNVINPRDDNELYREQSDHPNIRNTVSGTPLHSHLQDSFKSNNGSLYIWDNPQGKPQGNLHRRCVSSSKIVKVHINESAANLQDKSHFGSPNKTDQTDSCCIKGAGQKCQVPKQLSSSNIQSPQVSSLKHNISSPMNQVRFNENDPQKPNQPAFEKHTKCQKSHPSKPHFESSLCHSSSYLPPKSSSISSVPCEGCQKGCCPKSPTVKRKVECICSDEMNFEDECKKKPSCSFKDDTTSCASSACVVNESLDCICRYPPAFQYLSCSGNISGNCSCSDKK